MSWSSIVFSTRSALLLLAVFAVSGGRSCYGDEDSASVLSSPYFSDPGSIERPRSKVDTRTNTDKLSVPQLEQRMFESINQDRVKCGVSALKRSALLGKLARELADDMLANKFFAHKNSHGLNTPERAKLLGITCGVYENIASQSGPDSALQMVEEIEKGFMAEPSGRANHRYVLLHPNSSCAGVGIAKSKNEVIVVQEFTDDDPSPTGQP